MMSLRPHYAETLRLWREQFVSRLDTVAALGFDDVFARMWELYLAYSEAGFRLGLSRRLPVDIRPDRRTPVNLLIVTAVSLAALAVVHGATFFIGRKLGRYNVVDVAWGIGFIVVAAVSAVLGTGDLYRRVLLLILITVWAGRLSWHDGAQVRG